MLGLTRLLGRYAEDVHYVLGSVTSTDQAEVSFVARVSESHAESAFSVETRPVDAPLAPQKWAALCPNLTGRRYPKNQRTRHRTQLRVPRPQAVLPSAVS